MKKTLTLSACKVGVFYRNHSNLIFLKNEPLTHRLNVNVGNPIMLSGQCMQYVLLDSNMVVGSVFVVCSRLVVASSRKVVVGRPNNRYKPVYGIDNSGVLPYRGSEGGLLLVPTEIPQTFFLVRDLAN